MLYWGGDLMVALCSQRQMGVCQKRMGIGRSTYDIYYALFALFAGYKENIWVV